MLIVLTLREKKKQIDLYGIGEIILSLFASLRDSFVERLITLNTPSSGFLIAGW